MPFYERGDVRIHYQEVGSGFPLLLIPGGGLNSTMAWWSNGAYFNPMEEFKEEFRCISMDLRNSITGQSTGPLEMDRPWDAYADDQLGLMEHLGAQKFLVLGNCIGGPFIMNLLKRAPERIVAAVLSQPSGHRPEDPDIFWNNNTTNWGPALCAKRPDITMPMVERFLTRMYRSPADFMFTVTRDFVRSCRTPMLVLPDDIPPHPLAISMEIVDLAPNAEASIYPWKESKDTIRKVVEHVRTFLKSHEPAAKR
jgi:pimeloyl-ACP methyl ester carboxylesterase